MALNGRPPRYTSKSLTSLAQMQAESASAAIRGTKLWQVISLGFERARLDDQCALIGKGAPRPDKFGLPPFPSCRGKATDETCDEQIGWYNAYNAKLETFIASVTQHQTA